MRNLRRIRWAILACFFVSLLSLQANAQVASALIREGEALPGDTLGSAISGIGNTAQNGVGGYAFTVTTDGSFSHVWGNAAGGAGTVFRSESTIGNLQQTNFESFFGLSNAGVVSYSAITDNVSGSPLGLDGAWTDGTVNLNEEDPISALPGQFSTFNSRPDITVGGTPYWVGGYSDTQGGSTQDRALFFGANATVVLRGGDSITGITETVTVGSGIDFDFRFSDNGTNYISPIDVNSASSTDDLVIVTNGSALTAGGGIVRENSAVMAAGGLAGELWDNFDFVGITESGTYMVTGDTDADTARDEFVMIDGEIVLREGQSVGGLALSGSIEGAYLNEDGDWAVIWDVDQGQNNLEALILNGELLLLEGDVIDWNGDGVIDGLDQDGFIDNFSGISSLTLSNRDMNGNVTVAFTANVDINSGTILEGGFLMTVAIPEPGFASGVVVLGLLLVRRRRS